MNVREAEVLLAGIDAPTYLQNSCDCLICKELFNGKADLSEFARFSDTNDQGKFIPKAYAMCRFHFLFARRAEIVQMEKLSPTDRIASILKNAEFMQEIGAYDFVDHLTAWQKSWTNFAALNLTVDPRGDESRPDFLALLAELEITAGHRPVRKSAMDVKRFRRTWTSQNRFEKSDANIDFIGVGRKTAENSTHRR